MRCVPAFFCSLCVLSPLCLVGQTAPSKPAKRTTSPAPSAAVTAPDYKDEAGVFEHYNTTVRMQADGTGERVEHVVLRVQSEGAVRSFGVLAISFASATSTGMIEHVSVHKPDGTTVITPSSDALEVGAEVTREAPMYSDLKQIQLPIRSLSAGDRLEYDMRTVFTKAEAPGQFWGAERILPFESVVLDRTFTLEVPAGKYVQVWSPKHTAQRTSADGVVTYRWTTTQLKPTPKADAEEDDAAPKEKDPDEDEQGRKLPSIAWTTFHNWAEVGDWYRGLALQRAQPDDSLRARADALTKDAKTPQEQVSALYNFVATHVRYVGIDLGVGRFQPHAAGDVLSNQYGDCKDKDTLLEALLRAKGFPVAPALIGAGITPVPDVPSPAVFNHVITTVNLPSGRVWLDTTAEVAPYGYLVPQIRDQQALVIPDKGDAVLVKSATVPPYSFTSHFEAKGDLSADAVLHASINATYRNDEEVLLRAIARNLAPAEWDKGSAYFDTQAGWYGGSTSHTRFRGANDLASPMEISYDYTEKEYGNKNTHQIVALFPASSLISNADAKKEPEHDLELGVPRKAVAVSRIRIPEGWHVDLPDAVHEESAWVKLDKTYRFDNGEIVAERTVAVLQPKVPHAQWKEYQAFCKRADLGNEHWATLLPAKAAANKGESAASVKEGKGTAGNKAVAFASQEENDVAEAPPDASVVDLVRTAFAQMQAGQMTAMRGTLDRIKAKNPSQPGLQMLYGAAAEQNNQVDEAIADYRAELKAHPELPQMSWVVLRLAMLQERQGNSAEARETLQTAFRDHTDDLQIGSMLAASQSSAEQYNAAAATLQTVTEKHPDNLEARVQLGNALLAAGRKDEAAAEAKAALDGSTDPGVLNDAGYLLAETGRDLPAAEEVSRKSVATLEAKSRTTALQEVNSTSFRESNLLVAAWDTLGWILFREGKLDQAESYVGASWRNALHPEVGEHLGEVLEQRGDTAAAAAQYRLAQAAIEGGNASPTVRKAIAADLVRTGGSPVPEMSAAVAQQVREIEANKLFSAQQKQEMVTRVKSTSSPLGNAAHTSLQDLRTFHVERAAETKGWGTVRLLLSNSGVQAVEQSSGDPTLKAMLPTLKQVKFSGLVPAGSGAYLLRSGVLSCSRPKECELVLVPNGSLRDEQQQ